MILALHAITGLILAIVGLGWVVGFGSIALLTGSFGKPGLFAFIMALFGLLPLGWGLHFFGVF